AVFEYLFYHGVAGATVTRAIAGFGAAHRVHTSDLLAASDDLPIQIDFIESAARAAELLPKLRQLIGEGMIAVAPTEVVVAPGVQVAAPPPAQAELRGAGKLMRIYVGERDRWRGKPLHEALVESLRAHDIAGVTVYRGIAGYGGAGRKRADLPFSRDLPIMLSVVDTEARIRAYLPLLQAMQIEGLVVLSDVEVILYAHR
ncbi:MAG: DUF190 domain-containing protein, partial [Terriglobales bacterium]